MRLSGPSFIHLAMARAIMRYVLRKWRMARGYILRYYAKIFKWLQIKHKRTRYYTPKTNGKAERFIKTLLTEQAYVRPYTLSAERRAIDSFS